MNILHILPSTHFGGSELCAVETIKVLNLAGDYNYVIFPNEGDLIPHLANNLAGYSIVENSWWLAGTKWTLFFRLKMLKGYILSAFKIRRYIKKNSIDIVITHTLAIPSGAIAAKLSSKKHIWYIHEYGDIDHGFKFVFGKKNTLKIIESLSNLILVNSESLLEHFKSCFPLNKLVKVNYVVEYPLYEPMQTKVKDSLTICMVGRVAPGKNQLIALLALVQLKKEGIMPHILFVGSADQSYLNTLNIIITKHKLKEQVTFIGQSSEPWVYVQKSDVVLVCSKMEAFGRVTVEAMKSGKIAVVSETGAGKELIQHGKTGFLFNPDNALELAAILKQIWDMETGITVAKAAYTFAVTNFNEDIHKEQFSNIFKRIK